MSKLALLNPQFNYSVSNLLVNNAVSRILLAYDLSVKTSNPEFVFINFGFLIVNEN